MTYPLTPVRKSSDNLATVFGISTVALLLYELFIPAESFVLNAMCLLVSAIALLPAFLWCTGRALGMPIFPLFSLTFIWTYALPLVANNPSVLNYAVDQRMFAGFTAASFLSVGCIIWFQWVKQAPEPKRSYRSLTGTNGNKIFFTMLFISVLFNVASVGGWLHLVAFGSGVFPLLRNTVVAFTTLSSFVLAYRLGREDLSKAQSLTFLCLLSSFMLSSMLGFLLITSATVFLISVSAFVIGRRRVPVVLIVTVALIFSFLHTGKAEMRNRYWDNNSPSSVIQPWQYPSVYSEWITASRTQMDTAAQPDSRASRNVQTFGDRASVIHMLMLSQSLSPQTVPFLSGYTYQFLPEMLVPRILHPQKPWSHEGTFRLNIHYGRQTRPEAQRTTIAWGLLAESYANFGYWGCIALALICGSFYGVVSRMSINAPILSFQSLISVLLMTYAIQSEWTAGVYVAAISQHGIILTAMTLFLMQKQTNQQYIPQSYWRRYGATLSQLGYQKR